MQEGAPAGDALGLHNTCNRNADDTDYADTVIWGDK